MTLPRRVLEEQVVDYARRVHANGWVANHDGNVSVLLADGRYLITPTAYSKAAVTRDALLVVDADGRRVSGITKPFSELELHLYVYRHRPDVGAVLHAHPPTATGLAVAGVAIDPTMMAEPVVSLGAAIPLVPYARPRSAESTVALAAYLGDADALVLAHHGVLTMGPDLETAFLRMELVEHLARIQLVALQAGGVRQIPHEDVSKLLEARTQAGLGATARAASNVRPISAAQPRSR
ncbi:MAG: class II aldolase/adducin family protein [Myxococcota bacterium]